jgi:altronate hydrolase
MDTPDAAFLLAPQDNVAVARRPIAAGEAVQAGPHRIVAARAVAIGHKLAVSVIPAGGSVVKYNCPIGVATVPIAPGDYVHTHNVASAWIPSTLRPHHPS